MINIIGRIWLLFPLLEANNLQVNYAIEHKREIINKEINIKTATLVFLHEPFAMPFFFYASVYKSISLIFLFLSTKRISTILNIFWPSSPGNGFFPLCLSIQRYLRYDEELKGLFFYLFSKIE